MLRETIFPQSTAGRILVCIIVLAVILRLGALSVALVNVGQDAFIAGDAVGYKELAQNLVLGNGFAIVEDGVLRDNTYRTPGLPLIFAPFVLEESGIAMYGYLMSIVAGILLPLLTYQIAVRFGGPRVALFAAFLTAIEPHAVAYSFLLQTEMPFMILTLGGLLAGIKANERGSVLFTVFSGILLGAAVLFRPGFLPIFICLLVGIFGWRIIARHRHKAFPLLIIVALFLTVAPWSVRNFTHTGGFAISGAGWRNVYTDFLGSVRALENNTAFHVEKRQLKEEAMPRFGLSPSDINSPAYSNVLRDAALRELWQKKTTTLKLEFTLLASFFVQDGYFYEFRNLGYVHDVPGPHISPTYELLTNGIAGVPAIVHELARQQFIPAFGRLFTISIFIMAIAGFVLSRHPLKYMFAAMIVLTAVTSTVIGLGLDARMRVPVEPFLFMFAGVAIVRLIDFVRVRYAR